MPLGNLEEEHQRRRFSPLESLIVLRQTLSALSYLHQPQRELAHGQVNPCNILVQYRDPGDLRGHLHVKLSDFGSYRGLCSAQDLETYITPDEEETGMMTGDIWSLGIVVFELVYELPTRRGLSHLEWCHKVVAKVNSEKPSALVNILQKMLTIEPTARVSASVCLNEASRELNRFQSRSVTPPHASQAGNGKGKERDIGSPQVRSPQPSRDIPMNSLTNPAVFFSGPSILGYLATIRTRQRISVCKVSWIRGLGTISCHPRISSVLRTPSICRRATSTCQRTPFPRPWAILGRQTKRGTKAAPYSTFNQTSPRCRPQAMFFCRRRGCRACLLPAPSFRWSFLTDTARWAKKRCFVVYKITRWQPSTTRYRGQST